MDHRVGLELKQLHCQHLISEACETPRTRASSLAGNSDDSAASAGAIRRLNTSLRCSTTSTFSTPRVGFRPVRLAALNATPPLTGNVAATPSLAYSDDPCTGTTAAPALAGLALARGRRGVRDVRGGVPGGGVATADADTAARRPEVAWRRCALVSAKRSSGSASGKRAEPLGPPLSSPRRDLRLLCSAGARREGRGVSEGSQRGESGESGDKGVPQGRRQSGAARGVNQDNRAPQGVNQDNQVPQGRRQSGAARGEPRQSGAARGAAGRQQRGSALGADSLPLTLAVRHDKPPLDPL
eukprot:1013822-Prorocentrum_minimum.AAC.1